MGRSTPGLTILPEHIGEGLVADKEGAVQLYLQLPMHLELTNRVVARMAPHLFEQVGGALTTAVGVGSDGNGSPFQRGSVLLISHGVTVSVLHCSGTKRASRPPTLCVQGRRHLISIGRRIRRLLVAAPSA